MNGRRFGFASGVGLDAEIVRAVDELGRRSDGRRPGNVVVRVDGVRTLARHSYRLDPALEVDGHGRAAFALVSNGPSYSYAGRLRCSRRRTRRFEGGLDLVAPIDGAGARHPADRPLRGRLGRPGERRDLVYVHDVDRLEIVCDRPLPLQADGEDLGDVEHAVFEAERDAVTGSCF